MKRLLNTNFLLKISCLLGLLLLSASIWAQTPSITDLIYTDKTRLITQQTELLKNRLVQAKLELENLQRQQAGQDSTIWRTHTDKQLRNQAGLDVAVIKSNLDSVSMELSESQQAISLLDKEVREIENQLNAFTIFGLKIAKNASSNEDSLRTELGYQKNILLLEKERSHYLLDLYKITDVTLQLQKSKFDRISALLKSRKITRLKQEQAQSEMDFQRQQSHWLQQLNLLYDQLNKVEAAQVIDKSAYANLQREIFYANENVNLTYLQMLLVRYQDQLQQLQISILHSTSITLLNNASDQVLTLTKQLQRVKELLNTRLTILERRKYFLTQDTQSTAVEQLDLTKITELAAQYKTTGESVAQLDQKVETFRVTLDNALQYELSLRQGLPGYSAKEWLRLGAEVWSVPVMTYEVFKNVTLTLVKAIQSLTPALELMLGFLELALVVLFVFISRLLGKLIAGMAEHELGHINLKRLSTQIVRRNLIGIALIANILILFQFFGISEQSAGFIINLALVWLFFKVIVTMARICLVETVNNRAGHDVRLYYRLKWTFIVGGVITAWTVLMHQLPVTYEVVDLFDRLFLSFMLVVSMFLLKSWDIVPGLIIQHIDEHRLYLKKILRFFGFMVPLILLVNSAIGLFGYVNLVLTISWYESIFLIVLVGYLLLRGLLIDGMVLLSTLMIRKVNNGWLWTEAFLKPLDGVFRVILFLVAWAVLFTAYGWDQRSPVMIELDSILHHHIVTVFNTSITTVSVLKLMAVVSVLFWAARWTREFVFRLLSTRTKDMGLRNSIAILSQYALIATGGLICLRVLGIDIRALAVVAGAFAFGVGLGLRDLVNNFVCGFLLLIERPIRVGDTVTINDYEGEVMHIGGRAVTVRTWDHMDVLVPNADIFSKSITNWTAKDHIVRSLVSIKIHRHDSPQAVQSLIHQVLAKHRDVLAEPVPEVLLKEIDEGLIEFEVRYFINLRQVRSRLLLRSDVLMAIWEAFEANGIQPPYPHHEVHVKGNFPAAATPLLESREKLTLETVHERGK